MAKELFEDSKKGIWIQLSISSKLTDNEKAIAAQIGNNLGSVNLSNSLKLEAKSVLESAIKKGFVVSDSVKNILRKVDCVEFGVKIDKTSESKVKSKKSKIHKDRFSKIFEFCCNETICCFKRCTTKLS